MKVLSINIRATQGGAGRVGYDLHRRLIATGIDSRVLYGYASGIRPDPAVGDDPSIVMIGSRAAVMTNYAAHLTIGQEIVAPSRRILNEEIARADIVHLHAPHHWYLHWASFTKKIATMGKPLVITAHDWWLVSGRCGFVRDCTGWTRACGECGKRRFEDLPALVDRSAIVRRDRQRCLRRIASPLTIVCPSKHLQSDHRSIYPDLSIEYIPNALDLEFEQTLVAINPNQIRHGHVFCASDLNSPGKIDVSLVRKLAAIKGRDIRLVGRNSPFTDIDVTLEGEVRSRKQIAGIFASARSLLFTSQMDNAPLTIIEALSTGCYVVAYPSPAASEMLAMVGGRCASSPSEAETLVLESRESDLYGGASPNEIAKRARDLFSGDRLVQQYSSLYSKLIDSAKGIRSS